MSIHIRAHTLILLICLPPKHIHHDVKSSTGASAFFCFPSLFSCFVACWFCCCLDMCLFIAATSTCVDIFGQYSVIGQLIINSNKLTPFQLMNIHTQNTLPIDWFLSVVNVNRYIWIFKCQQHIFFLYLSFEFQKKLIFKRNHYRIFCKCCVYLNDQKLHVFDDFWIRIMSKRYMKDVSIYKMWSQQLQMCVWDRRDIWIWMSACCIMYKYWSLLVFFFHHKFAHFNEHHYNKSVKSNKKELLWRHIHI